MRFLLDTNICIYALKRRPPEVLDRLSSVGRTAVALSVVSVLTFEATGHRIGSLRVNVLRMLRQVLHRQAVLAAHVDAPQRGDVGLGAVGPWWGRRHGLRASWSTWNTKSRQLERTWL